MPRRTIPDASGARVTLLISNAVRHTQHRHTFHVDQLNHTTGAYTVLDSGSSAEVTVWDTINNYMAFIKGMHPLNATIEYFEAQAVSGGVASVYLIPPTTPPPVVGTDGNPDTNPRAGVVTFTTVDAYRNRAALVYAGLASGIWAPDTVTTVVADPASTNLPGLAAYLLGILPASGARLPRFVTRAGGVYAPSFRAVSSLNKRLRREYNLD